jgi:hypothetical protein
MRLLLHPVFLSAITLAILFSSSPVLAASSSSSSGDASSCGPNPLECILGYRPLCSGGQWKCVKRSGGTGTAPVLTTLLPNHAKFGKRVTIIGSGFTKKDNIIHIGDNVIRGAFSTNGKSITFIVPRLIKPACIFDKPPCKYGVVRLEQGAHQLSVETEGKTSEPLTLTIVK